MLIPVSMILALGLVVLLAVGPFLKLLGVVHWPWKVILALLWVPLIALLIFLLGWALFWGLLVGLLASIAK